MSPTTDNYERLDNYELLTKIATGWPAETDAPPELTTRLREHLLDTDPHQLADRPHIGQKLRISGFAEIDDGGYQELRKARDELETN